LTQFTVNANIVTMTIYTPSLKNRPGPKYRAIADAIQDDIHNRVLAVGEQLPTHRELAFQLAVTVGTVTRAYGELQRCGVIGGRVGRGTYVLSQNVAPDFHPPNHPDKNQPIFTITPLLNPDHLPDLPTGQNPQQGHDNSATTIDLSMNRPPPGPEAEALAETLGALSKSGNLSTLTQYNPAPGIRHHREAMASLLNTFGLEATADDLILTSGAQHAMAASAMAVLKSGDVMLTENYTYPGMTSLAAHLGVRLHPVAMDEYGLRTDALEAAILETGARVVYVMPVHQNPTTAVMNQDRLDAIAKIVKRNDMLVIEDDVYGFQPQDRLVPLAQLAPEHTIYINGFAKSISPGLRVGFIKSPKALFASLTRAVQITGWMTPPLMGEIAARWITSGVAQQIIAWHRAEMIARNRMAADILQNFTFAAKPESLHMWMDLPDGHGADNTIHKLAGRGVFLAGPESFITTQPSVPRTLRLCLGAPPTRERLRTALVQVRDVLSAQPGQAPLVNGSMVM